MFYAMLVSVILASVFMIIWLFLYIRYRKRFDGMLDGVDERIFILKDLYFIGLGAIGIYESIYRKKISASPKAIEKQKKLSEVFGRDNAEFYYYINTGALITMILTFIPLAFCLMCIMRSVLGLVIGLLMAGGLIYGIQSSINSSIQRKKDAILSEFPKMVSKITLLINAGMLVRRAWDEVANSNYEEALYAEMRFASKDLQEGKTIEEAMSSFASRCGLKEMRKFASIYVQAVTRGPSESIQSMKIMADEAWEQRKQIAKQQGEIASQKLMIPNLIMFFGIMIIVVVPIVAGMFGSINM